MKIYLENPNLVKLVQKCRSLHMKTEVRIIIAGDVNPPQKRVYASLDFKLLTVTCS